MTSLFWEQVHPAFGTVWDADFRAWTPVRGLLNQRVDWRWRFQSTEDPIERLTLSIGEARATIQAAVKDADTGIHELPNPGILVLHSIDLKDSYVTCGVVAASLENLMMFSRNAPFWWQDGDLSFFSKKSNDIAAKIRMLDSLRSRTTGLPREEREGYCGRCGLPLERHVPHEPPGVQKPDNGSPAADWGPWMRASKQHYGDALLRLTDEEILAMPLGINKLWLRTLDEELKRRENVPKVVVELQSALDMLLDDD